MQLNLATQSPDLRRLATEAAEQLTHLFRGRPHCIVAAPGRVNMIGEHVDYNDGFVLPMAIQRYTILAAKPGPGPVAQFYSSAQGDSFEIPLDQPFTAGTPSWTNYIRGILAGFAEKHALPAGIEAAVHGNLSLGGGLSSSAALEVGTCLMLEALTGKTLETTERILLCQKAEHRFAGVPCGIMDQFIVTRGQKDHLLLLDCRSLESRMVRFDDPTVTVLITNCGVAHELGKGEYAKRRAQCERAAEILGVKSLRDAAMDVLRAGERQLANEEFRRARHVIGEIQRTLDFAAAIERKDWPMAGQLMYQSHESLRDDYEVSCAELDTLVDIARGIGEAGGVYGSRLTGGGFGGCTVTLVRTEKVEQVQDAISREYLSRTGVTARMFVSRPAQGAMRLL